MKCLICGAKCHTQMALGGEKAKQYPNLCPTCNKRRQEEILIMSKDGLRYAFIPSIRTDGEVKIEAPKFKHPRNFWLVPGPMIKTVMEKLYPLTEEEKRTKEQIKELEGEKEELECEISDIENKIEDLEQELSFNPEREIKTTWLMGAAPEIRSQIMGAA